MIWSLGNDVADAPMRKVLTHIVKIVERSDSGRAIPRAGSPSPRVRVEVRDEPRAGAGTQLAPRARMSTLLADVRHAFRLIGRSPGYAIAVVVTLALGIGANTAIFSVVRAVVLRPLPYAEPERILFAADRPRI